MAGIVFELIAFVGVGVSETSMLPPYNRTVTCFFFFSLTGK